MSRMICGGCERPVSVCLCASLLAVKPPCSVVIWQDPTESRHRLSTTPLLHKTLLGSRLIVGDIFSYGEVLQAAGQPALVFPLEHKSALTGSSDELPIGTLLLLDGTWRKVRRLFHLNPWLYDLPHIRLAPEQLSRYRIRKSPREDGVSTLEAGLLACQWLDPKGDYLTSLSVLDRMVELQQSFIK